MNLNKNELILLICEYVGCDVNSVKYSDIKKFVEGKEQSMINDFNKRNNNSW